MPDCLTFKKSNCKNCYKCIRHCPVKSIRFSGNQAHIIGNECILCGNCVVTCPQNAKQVSDGTEKVKVLLNGSDPVIASLAPSFVANYDGATIEDMKEVFKKLGFADAEETAYGAMLVTKEYERIISEENRDIIITSACHSLNLLIQKHYPNELKYLADVVSPMQAHCMEIKRRIPNAKTVFVGPCVAKKDEAEYYSGIVDAVLTFEELTRMMNEAGVSIEKTEKTQENGEEGITRFYPTSGGILRTMVQEQDKYNYLVIDGVENCMAALQEIEEGKIHRCFIEMSSCAGSCLNGPVMERKSPVKDFATVANYAGKKNFELKSTEPLPMRKQFTVIPPKLPKPTENELCSILRQMGKFKAADELNCGSCGYDSCREKAVAIYQGKAEVGMCLPFLKDRAENFSDNIVNNTPNGIIVLNETLEVQQINNAARKIMKINSASDVLGENVIRILDPKPFTDVLYHMAEIRNQRTYLAEYRKYVDMTVVFDREYRLFICIMRDVTDEESERERKEQISKDTIEIADKVVDKQMRIVQEIASLLGETAAETKIALTKLKESITNE